MYGYRHVECRSHEYKRDREPSRVPENMLKRLSQKNKKLLSYVWSCLRKNVPKSSKIHRFIKHTARRQKRTHKIAVRFVQKMRRKPIFRGLSNTVGQEQQEDNLKGDICYLGNIYGAEQR